MSVNLEFPCPVCSKERDHPTEALVERAKLRWGLCDLELTLKRCMWKNIQREKPKLQG